MDKIIVTALLVIAGVISAVFVFNAIYPATTQSADALTSMERRIDDQLKSEIAIVHAAQSGSDVVIWVKNIGSLRVAAVEACDIFFGPEGNFARIPYQTGAIHWDYVIENATDWVPTATIQVTIANYPFSAPGTRYFAKIVLPNGVSNEYTFSE